MAKTSKKLGYKYAVGRRKSATARVRFYENSDQKDGAVLIDGKLVEEVLSEANTAIVKAPIELVAAELGGYFTVKVEGGGLHAQAEAIRLGISRLLLEMKEDWRSLLKSKGYLTRDPRVKERKKPGLKRARRAPQWSKR